MKYVFMDLDETLIHSRFVSEHTTQFKGIKIDLGNGEVYDTILCPGAFDILTALRDRSDIVMPLCTVSTQQYAKLINNAFKLGFTEIYAREEIEARAKIAYRGECYLIDDKEPWAIQSKFVLLRPITCNMSYPLVKLINVEPFWSVVDQKGFDAAEIKRIMDKIYE